MRHKIAGFYHRESNEVLNDVFLRCVPERYDVSVLLEETAFVGHTKRRRDLLGAEACGRHPLHGETLLCGSHHVAKRLENMCDLSKMWLVVYGHVIKSIMCVIVSMESVLRGHF